MTLSCKVANKFIVGLASIRKQIYLLSLILIVWDSTVTSKCRKTNFQFKKLWQMTTQSEFHFKHIALLLHVYFKPSRVSNKTNNINHPIMIALKSLKWIRIIKRHVGFLGFLAHLEQNKFWKFFTLKISQPSYLWTDFHDCWLSGLNFFCFGPCLPQNSTQKINNLIRSPVS